MFGKVVRERVKKGSTFRRFPFYINDMKQSVKKKLKSLQRDRSEEIAAKQRELGILRRRLESLVSKFDFHDRCDLEEKISNLEKEIKRISKKTDLTTFVRAVHPLLESSTQAASIILGQHVDSDTLSKPYYLDLEKCQECGISFEFDADTTTLSCPNCGACEFMLWNIDMTKTNTKMSKSSSSTYERWPLYRKFLTCNFHENAEEIPASVIEAVTSSLKTVHISTSHKVKPTPISTILRQKGLQKYCPAAIRISLMINRQPIVKLTDEIIDRLVSRFLLVVEAFKKIQSSPSTDNNKSERRKKIVNFSFLTRAFLLAENRQDLANYFVSHKTRTVLVEADKRLRACIDVIRENGNDKFEWNVPRLA